MYNLIATKLNLNKLNSIIFRLLLFSYSLYIYFYVENIRNINESIIILSIILYLPITFYLITKYPYFAKLRLVLDYVFIYVIIFNKQIDNFNIIVFSILPLINSYNHSRQNVIPLNYLLLTCQILLLFIVGGLKHLIDILPLLTVISILAMITYLKLKFYNYISSFDLIFNDFNSQNLLEQKDYKLLQNLVDKVKSNKLLYVFIPIENIIILHKKSNSKDLGLVASSSFVTSISYVSDDLKFENNVLSNMQFKYTGINNGTKFNITSNYNYSYLIENRKEYIVTVLFSRPVNQFVFESFKFRVFNDFINKLIKVIETESEFRSISLRFLKQYNSNVNYFNKIKNAIHDFSNKLGPINSYFEVLKSYEKQKGSDPNTTVALGKLLETLKVQAPKSLDSILRRNNKLLEHAPSQFEKDIVEKISVEKLISNLRVILLEDENINVKINIEYKYPEFYLKDIYYNENFYLDFLEEVKNNVLKHGKNNTLNIYVVNDNENDMTISFENSFNRRDLTKVTNIVKKFNLQTINEILSLKSYGLGSLKKLLISNSIMHNAKTSTKDGDSLFKLSIKLDLL